MLQALLYLHHEDVYAYTNAAQILSAMLLPHAVNQGWQVFAGWWKNQVAKEVFASKNPAKIDFAT